MRHSWNYEIRRTDDATGNMSLLLASVELPGFSTSTFFCRRIQIKNNSHFIEIQRIETKGRFWTNYPYLYFNDAPQNYLQFTRAIPKRSNLKFKAPVNSAKTLF